MSMIGRILNPRSLCSGVESSKALCLKCGWDLGLLPAIEDEGLSLLQGDSDYMVKEFCRCN